MEDFLTILGLVILVLFALFITPFLVMLLWNSLMVSIFGAPALSFWQTFGLIIMIRLIAPNTIIKKRDSQISRGK